MTDHWETYVMLMAGGDNAWEVTLEIVPPAAVSATSLRVADVAVVDGPGGGAGRETWGPGAGADNDGDGNAQPSRHAAFANSEWADPYKPVSSRRRNEIALVTYRNGVTVSYDLLVADDGGVVAEVLSHWRFILVVALVVGGFVWNELRIRTRNRQARAAAAAAAAPAAGMGGGPVQPLANGGGGGGGS